jgi:putative transposase
MRWIDELFTAWPFLGSRRMTAMLRAEGVFVNRKRVQRLMRLMGIAALGPRPRTSKPAQIEKAAPDRNIGNVGSPDVVRVLDRQIAQEIGIDLVAVWRLSNTMDVSFRLVALEEALAKFDASTARDAQSMIALPVSGLQPPASG